MKSAVERSRLRRVASPADRQERRVHQADRQPAMPAYITLFQVIITYNDVMAPDNPFVYGEIVTAGAFADRDAERARLGADLAAGQKVFLISPRRYGKSSLVRDVLRGLARQKDAHRRGHGRLVQLVRRLPRILRPGAGRRRHAGRPAPALGRRAAAGGAARAALRLPTQHARQARGFALAFPGGPHRARHGPARQRGLRAARPHRRRPQAAHGDRARRVPGDRRRSTAAASSTRCAPRCRTSARSATSSPAPSRR